LIAPPVSLFHRSVSLLCNKNSLLRLLGNFEKKPIKYTGFSDRFRLQNRHGSAKFPAFSLIIREIWTQRAVRSRLSSPPTSRSIFRQSGESLKIGARAGFAEIARGEIYRNYRSVKEGLTEHAAMSAFCKNPSGELFNTYSCYARGLDTLNAATGST
jgi:hypothetical protein